MSREYNDGTRSRRASLDGYASAARRRSVELAVAMHRDELAAHLESGDRGGTGQPSHPSSGSSNPSNRVSFSPDDLKVSMDSSSIAFQDPITLPDEGLGDDDDDDINGDDVGESPARSRRRTDALPRRKTVINATILKNFEAAQTARGRRPRSYPALVTRLIPRLGRVASPVEKLFWFGSHKFFLWCVEFVLFFSTVLLAASAARLSLSLVTKDVISGVQTASLVLSGANLAFVLLRIAVIIKRYIFILHNAGLIPEVVALETILAVQSSRSADGLDVDVNVDTGHASFLESETEVEDDDASRERHTRLGRFFRSQAESGNMPGFSADDARTAV